jgi:hypothetical protein
MYSENVIKNKLSSMVASTINEIIEKGDSTQSEILR